MKGRFIIILFIVSFILASDNNCALGQPTLESTVNNSNQLIGGITKLKIRVKASTNANVSWKLCDELFEQSQQVVLLQINAIPHHNGYFEHEIVFTCVKAAKLSFAGLPVQVSDNGQQKTLLTPLVEVNFKTDRSPDTLYDIVFTPVGNQIDFLWALLKVSLLVTIFILFIFYYLKRNAKPASLPDTQKIYLARLDNIISQKDIDLYALVDRTQKLIREYSHQVQFINRDELPGKLENGETPHLKTSGPQCVLLEKYYELSNELRFAPYAPNQHIINEFINNIKELIISY